MKESKSSVNYRKGTGDRRCDNCTMWRDGRCTAVAGPIQRDMLCDLFKLRAGVTHTSERVRSIRKVRE